MFMQTEFSQARQFRLNLNKCRLAEEAPNPECLVLGKANFAQSVLEF